MALITEEIISTLKENGFQVRNDSNLNIIKTTDSSNLDIAKLLNLDHVDLKGLIFGSNGEIVCTGVKVPSNTDTLDDVESLAPLISKMSTAQDGVMARLYHDGSEFRASTNGMIYPNRGWGPRGCRTFVDLLADFPYDVELLNKNWCYYVIMEHQDQTNIIKHQCNRLVLTKIVDKHTLAEVDLDMDTVFDGSNPLFTKSTYVTDPEECQTLFSKHLHVKMGDPAPVTEVGLNIFLRDGRVYRLETPQYRAAAALKPNLADPRQHWTDLLEPIQSEETMGYDMHRCINTYLQYFPWNSDTFKHMDELFTNLVCDLLDEYYDIYTYGFNNVSVPSRYVKFHKELQGTFTNGELSAFVLIKYLINRSPKHLYYLLNPDGLGPRDQQVHQDAIMVC